MERTASAASTSPLSMPARARSETVRNRNAARSARRRIGAGRASRRTRSVFGKDSISEGQGAAEQRFVFHAREAAQFCLVGKNRVFDRRVRKNDFGSGSL